MRATGSRSRAIGEIFLGILALFVSGAITALAFLLYRCGENCTGPPARGGLRSLEMVLAVIGFVFVVAALRHVGRGGRDALKLFGVACVAYAMWGISLTVL